MDNMIKSAPSYTGVCDSVSEPNYNSETCGDCNGVGKLNYSDCCGELTTNNICSHCGDICVESPDICETCGGEGEL